MQRIPVMPCGDGIPRADHGSLGMIHVKTADYTVEASDAGKVFSNKGAEAKVTFTLPAPKAGMYFTFMKQTAQELWITATGGAKIHGGTADKSYKNAAAETTANATIFSDGTDWFLLGAVQGTWAADNS